MERKPTTTGHGGESPADTMKLLRAFGDAGWSIERHDLLRYWSAERAIGSEIRYLCAPTAHELATLIESAEAGS